MGFLDNSGDIILDAVLTDTGRFRIARGGFKITKFALEPPRRSTSERQCLLRFADHADSGIGVIHK